MLLLHLGIGLVGANTRISSHGGLSEEWIGEWVEERSIRNQVVIASKVSRK